SGIFMAKSTWCVDVIISKSLFDEKLKITLAGSDLFKAEKDSWLVKKDGLQMDNIKNNDSRCVSLRVQYKFNTANSKYKGTSASNESQRL
ncbi:MAG: hypothetical protein II502_03265, partial [Paludibacteraceae bacterium]|nr:hypothetical protein [Paludibacteraceae bacterium]